MAIIISGSIDLTKIDKSKIVNHKNGAKYYPLQIFVNDEKDKYGQDVGITDSQTPDQRKAKEKKKYIGNGKIVWQSNPPAAAAADNSGPHSEPTDLPF